MSEQLGAMLVRLRQRKGWTQLRMAEALCTASGVVTVTRHEVSRWERQERIPSVAWLGWLAVVLEVPVAELAAAAAITKKQAGASVSAQPDARSAAVPSGDGGTKVPPPETAQQTRPEVNAPRASDNGIDPLSRVTLEFKHRTTCVRLSATYDDPQRALSAIGAFQSMVGVEEVATPRPGHTQAVVAHPASAEAAVSDAQGGVTQAAHVVSLSQRRRSRRATAALTASVSTDIPMGIRYTGGPAPVPGRKVP